MQAMSTQQQQQQGLSAGSPNVMLLNVKGGLCGDGVVHVAAHTVRPQVGAAKRRSSCGTSVAAGGVLSEIPFSLQAAREWRPPSAATGGERIPWRRSSTGQGGGQCAGHHNSPSNISTNSSNTYTAALLRRRSSVGMLDCEGGASGISTAAGGLTRTAVPPFNQQQQHQQAPGEVAPLATAVGAHTGAMCAADSAAGKPQAQQLPLSVCTGRRCSSSGSTSGTNSYAAKAGSRTAMLRTRGAIAVTSETSSCTAAPTQQNTAGTLSEQRHAVLSVPPAVAALSPVTAADSAAAAMLRAAAALSGAAATISFQPQTGAGPVGIPAARVSSCHHLVSGGCQLQAGHQPHTWSHERERPAAHQPTAQPSSSCVDSNDMPQTIALAARTHAAACRPCTEGTTGALPPSSTAAGGVEHTHLRRLHTSDPAKTPHCCISRVPRLSMSAGVTGSTPRGGTGCQPQAMFMLSSPRSPRDQPRAARSPRHAAELGVNSWYHQPSDDWGDEQQGAAVHLSRGPLSHSPPAGPCGKTPQRAAKSAAGWGEAQLSPQALPVQLCSAGGHLVRSPTLSGRKAVSCGGVDFVKLSRSAPHSPLTQLSTGPRTQQQQQQCSEHLKFSTRLVSPRCPQAHGCGVQPDLDESIILDSQLVTGWYCTGMHSNNGSTSGQQSPGGAFSQGGAPGCSPAACGVQRQGSAPVARQCVPPVLTSARDASVEELLNASQQQVQYMEGALTALLQQTQRWSEGGLEGPGTSSLRSRFCSS